MKVLSLKNKIDLTFLLVAVVFCGLIWSTYNRAYSVTKNRHIISQTYNTNTVLEKILSSMIDIETGARGYTITGKENFLEIYESGNKDVEEWIDSLEDMKRGKSADDKRISELKRLIDSKKAFTILTIEARRNKGMEEAAAMISTGQGKAIMDSLRERIAVYQKSQLQILTEKLAETDANIKARNFNFFLFVIVMFALLVFAYGRIRMNAKQMMIDGVIQEKLSDELAYQNQQLNDFANITSHNLRSSAANMTSLISLVDEKSGVEEYRNVFTMMRKVASNLNDSLNELIEILRIKKSRPADKEPVHFVDVYLRVTETLQGDVLNNKATLESDFNEAPTVMFSKIHLESVLQNLIGNAMKYKSPDRDPVIKVRSEIQNGEILLHISDNGLGIDLERHGNKIFGMYQMFHKHPDAKGIGLFITKAQIENLGGTITVTSDGINGSTFTVNFGKR
ncbi:CHASE3 domain-containing protein [Flavobacterium sp. MAH-1]|uniref:histidine kinase n=1 Tax=Flavobacterium agri TaxID=2743471 RepID=A0A7Y8Y1M0_9FLAO|nr:CHASE3 domain-containing protein [Flavobacterium agri]NUY80935.1 CHASE3 domain-containing protein [Flavobacterium agri]NYA70959.1 CHASE3 domain-containing protein [Flavobacterium agri]